MIKYLYPIRNIMKITKVININNKKQIMIIINDKTIFNISNKLKVI